MVWDRVHEVARNDVVFGECSIPRRCCCEDGVWAKVVFAVPAIAAVATRHTRLDCYSLPDFDVRYFIAYFDDRA
jgi:hypothetical protein